jgi:membrane associated rhomboid family serine protease
MFQSSTGVKTIFYINVAMFIFMSLLSLIGIGFPTEHLACWDMGSPNFSWYQLITAMFIHGGVFHILANMLAFISLGPVVEDIMETKRFYIYYLLCGLIGGIAQSTMTVGPAVGASGAIWGITMMFAFISPNTKLSLFFIPIGIKAKYLIGVLFAIEAICCLFGSKDGIGHFAHAGGAITGLVLILMEKYIFKNPNL